MSDLSQKTDDELAKWQAGWNTSSHYYLLAEKEWERRARIEQHNLNLHLTQEQTKMLKSSLQTSAKVTIAATLIGAIVGAVVQAILPEMIRKAPKTTTQQTTQPETKPVTSVARPEKTIDKVPYVILSK
jgi:hypothetical protein